MLADVAVLRQRSYRNLFLSQTVSLLGSAIAPIALAFAILDEPGDRLRSWSWSWRPGR